ncbi:MAG: archease [Candidatus Nanohaloarchaea archaeon]
MSYEILEHTADEKFRATGGTLEEAFSEATRALSEIVGGGEGMYSHDIEIESENLEALLFDFLDRLIFLQDTEGVAVSHLEEIEIEEVGEIDDGFSLTATVLVDTLDAGGSYLDIKAPTYSEMKVDHEDGRWILEAVLDI